MKQHITKENLDTLSNKGREKLASWYADWQFKQGNQFVGLPLEVIDEKTMRVKVPLMSIGQMIDFLDEHMKGIDIRIRHCNYKSKSIYKEGTLITDIYGRNWSVVEDEPNLCDALWEAVKEILEA